VIADKGTGEVLVTRILTQNSPTTTVDGLLSGVKTTISATAYPLEDGSGTPLARAVVEAVVPVESRQSIALTLASTIASVTLEPSSVALRLGDSIRVTATALDADGSVVPVGQPWEWASSNASVATVTSDGIVRGVGSGTASVRATDPESKRTSDTAVTVTVAPPASRVAFWNATDLQFQIVDNEAGATPANLDLGGVYFLFGAQRHGSLVFVTQAGYMNPQIRNLATGVSTDFEPTTFSMWVGGLGFKLADISTDGQSVVWIRQSGGNRQIVRADVDGSNEVVLVSSAAPALMPARVAISPDGTEVGYITSTGTVRRISTAGGASVFLNLNGSTGAVSIDWRDDDNLVVGCANALGTGSQGIITVPRDVSPASILFNDGGTGLRSVPASVATDPDGNILFDEVDAGLTQREIYRVDPPGLAARIDIVTRAQNDAGVWSLFY